MADMSLVGNALSALALLALIFVPLWLTNRKAH